MSGRNAGRGRGNINLTAAELQTLLNDHAVAALAAHVQNQAGGPAGVCTFKNYLDCKPNSFKGTEGAIGFLRWAEKVESAFEMCNCPPASRVKFVTGTLEDSALTWWNSNVQILGLDLANAMNWEEFKNMMREEYCPREEIAKLESEFWALKMVGSEIEAYTTRSHKLAVMCPRMVDPPSKRIEMYIDGLVPQIQGMVTSSKSAMIQQAIRIAHKLTDQAVAQGALPPRGSTSKTHDNTSNDNNNNNNSGNGKRKFDNTRSSSSNPPQQQHHRKPELARNFNNQGSNNNNNGGGQGSSGYDGKYPKCNKCNYHHVGPCDRIKCLRCGKLNHQAKDCRGDLEAKGAPKQPTATKECFECGQEGHFKKDCPKLKQNEKNGGNNSGGSSGKCRAFVIGSGQARNDPNVVTGKFLVNDCFASILFDTGADRSFVSKAFSKLLDLTPTP
ncbi:uncharacterized protein LOC143529902 [Bidens hawaiensis]|uniref:uncharacterized protein LOC143529902 n=1 Tax=Bidens hawaiensis TaxID=980011 RepID=UPI00404925E3